MPRMTVYIRNDDLDKWRALKNKSAAISQLLNETLDIPPPETQPMVEVFEKPVNKPGVKLCKNGHPLDKWGLRCLEMGCKYA